MAQPQRPLSPFMHYRWQYTNTTSILHRVTGIVLTLCFFVLVYWLAAAAAGADRYRAALETIGSPLVQLVLFGGLFSFCYHLLNGIRHLFFDAGYGFELPVARRTGWAVVLGAVALTVVFWVALGATIGGAA
ncbi:MAG TPA: succinate dehydrogenase, cytochrome b556 subunit [Steroidobacteraceae bacterium]|nr:succinate dehydrogenase, cytochrome b556 subunit [Steroidobacteraceae bacterium]